MSELNATHDFFAKEILESLLKAVERNQDIALQFTQLERQAIWNNFLLKPREDWHWRDHGNVVAAAIPTQGIRFPLRASWQVGSGQTVLWNRCHVVTHLTFFIYYIFTIWSYDIYPRKFSDMLFFYKPQITQKS